MHACIHLVFYKAHFWKHSEVSNRNQKLEIYKSTTLVLEAWNQSIHYHCVVPEGLCKN